MINPEHKLSLTRQAQLLQLSRASLYYEPVAASQADLELMRRLDELHLEWPFLGSRMLRDILRLEGIRVGRRHVATLMCKMGIEALCRWRSDIPQIGRSNFPHLSHQGTMFPASTGGCGRRRRADCRGTAYDIGFASPGDVGIGDRT